MKNIKILYVIAAALALASCSKEEEAPEGAGAPVVFELAVDGFTRGGDPSRANDLTTVNYPVADYFGIGGTGFDRIDITDGNSTATYVYSAGALTTSDASLRFPIDGAALTFSTAWPHASATIPPAADQTSKAAFLANDPLTWTRKVVTTASSVMIVFSHVNPKVTLVAGGAAAGSKITALEIAGYKAYCDASASVVCAQLMVPVTSKVAFQTAAAKGATVTATIDGVGAKTFALDQAIALPSGAGGNYTITLNL